jgi:hypothetical protein
LTGVVAKAQANEAFLSPISSPTVSNLPVTVGGVHSHSLTIIVIILIVIIIIIIVVTVIVIYYFTQETRGMATCTQ